MRRLRRLLVASVIAGVALPLQAPGGALADAPPTPPQQLDRLNQQLTADQTKLNELNDQVERAQGDLDRLNRKLSEDQKQEVELDKQLAMLGRLEYEQPAFSLSNILEASSLSQLLSNIAQARLVAGKQRNLLNQTRDLRRQDQQARDQMSAQLTSVQSARDQASVVAARTLGLRNTAQDAAVRARAELLAAQASATQAPRASTVIARPTSGGSYPNHFAYGYCTYYVATRRYVPWFGNAIEWWPNARTYGYPEGATPQVGSIMVTRESGFGHVAYVESVSGSTFTVSEMNFVGWNIVSRRTITLGGPVPIVGFIYGQ